MFVPDIEKAYVDRDPKHNHYWYAPGGVISRLHEPDQGAVRRRRVPQGAHHRRSTTSEVIDQAQLGYVSQASQTGLVDPGPGGLAARGPRERRHDAVRPGRPPTRRSRPPATSKTPRAAGSTRTASRSRSPSRCPGDYVDWVAAADILVENLPGARLHVDPGHPDAGRHDQDRKIGNYDMMFGVYGGSCNMYRNFSDPLDSERTAADRREGAEQRDPLERPGDRRADRRAARSRRRGRAEAGRRRPGRDHDGPGADDPASGTAPSGSSTTPRRRSAGRTRRTRTRQQRLPADPDAPASGGGRGLTHGLLRPAVPASSSPRCGPR